MTTFGISERRACGLLGVWRSSCRYKQEPDRDSELREQLTEWRGNDRALDIADSVYCWLEMDK